MVANQFDCNGLVIITGSFDGTIRLWDTRTAKYVLMDRFNWIKILSNSLILHRCIATLSGHTAELSACRYDFSCKTIASGSLDSTVKLWDVRKTNECRETIAGHTDEVLIYKHNIHSMSCEKLTKYVTLVLFII